MKITLFDKEYEMNPQLTRVAKECVNQQFLDALNSSRDKGIPEFYTHYLIMAYTTSARLIKAISKQQLLEDLRIQDIQELDQLAEESGLMDD